MTKKELACDLVSRLPFEAVVQCCEQFILMGFEDQLRLSAAMVIQIEMHEDTSGRKEEDYSMILSNLKGVAK